MNFNDLQECCWRFLGLHDSGQRPDWRRQLIKDSINECLDEVAGQPPFVWNLVKESTLSIVNGTSIYTLNDWVARPLFLWTADSGAHKVRFLNYRTSTRDHSRNSSASYESLGPWELSWYPRSSALLSGSAASATDGATSITGLSGVTDAMAGRMIRLNGEDNDYKILSQTGGTAVTVDRAVHGRLTGTGTTGTPANYSSVRWEISPAGRYRVQILPTPTTSQTVYYAYRALPRRLINTSDTPEINDNFHHLLWKGALCRMGGFNEDDATFQRYKAEYEQAREELRRSDDDDADCEDAPHFESLLDGVYPGILPVDSYTRYNRYRG